MLGHMKSNIMTMKKKKKNRRFEGQTHQDLDPFLQHRAGVVGGLADPHHGGHAVLLQLLSGVTTGCHTLLDMANALHLEKESTE